MGGAFGFKHHDVALELLGDQCTCPPSHTSPSTDTVAYRFVFDKCDDLSFIPQAVVFPDNFKGTECNKCCEYFSLSFYLSYEDATGAHAYLRSKFKKFVDRSGGYLAMGRLSEGDGLVTDADERSHFELYEANTVNLSKRFNLLEKLA